VIFVFPLQLKRRASGEETPSSAPQRNAQSRSILRILLRRGGVGNDLAPARKIFNWGLAFLKKTRFWLLCIVLGPLRATPAVKREAAQLQPQLDIAASSCR